MITLALTAPASAAYFGSPYQENTGMLDIKPWLKEVVAFKQFEAMRKERPVTGSSGPCITH